MYQPQKKESAFTLVEMAIVLVIVGLLIGGIVAGKDLILVSQRNSIIKDWKNLETSLQVFRMKYNGLPGDLRNASTFWPTARNGNGDKAIWNTGDSFGHAGIGMERCDMFSHLTLSKLIKDQFDVCVHGFTVGERTPKILFNERTNYLVSSDCNEPSCTTTPSGTHYIITDGMYNNSAAIQLRSSISLHIAESPFTPDDMLYFDEKLDDGKPLTGNFVLLRGSSANPISSALSTDVCVNQTQTDQYNLALSYPSKSNRVCHAKLKLNL